MYRDHTVAVVIPAFNEEAFVGEVIETIPDFVDRIYAVDDRSTDGTWEEILRHASRAGSTDPGSGTGGGSRTDGGPRQPSEVSRSGDEDGGRTAVRTDASGVDDRGSADTSTSRVVPIRHEQNRGVGAAITTGYRRALADGVDVTAVMAGDGQMDPDQLDRLLDPIVDGRAAYAKGNRLLGDEYYDEMSPFRLFGNFTLSVLTKVSSGYWEILDPQNGYTAISATALEVLDLDALYEEYGFTNDLLVRLNTAGFRVADVAMPAVYGDEESHIQYRTFVPELSWLLLHRFGYRLRVKYLLTDFHPLAFLYGLGTIGVGAAIAGLAAAVDARSNAESRAGVALTAAVLAILSLTCIVLAMIFDRRANEGSVVTVR